MVVSYINKSKVSHFNKSKVSHFNFQPKVVNRIYNFIESTPIPSTGELLNTDGETLLNTDGTALFK